MRINQSNTNLDSKAVHPMWDEHAAFWWWSRKLFFSDFLQFRAVEMSDNEDNLGIGTGNWLIFLDYRNLFNLRVHWCILAFLCVLYIKVYKCRPSCISYFLRSRGYVFLTHRAGGMGEKKNFTLFAFSWKSLLWPLFFPGLNGRTGFLPRRQ